MKYVSGFTGGVVLSLLVVVLTNYPSQTSADVVSGQVLVQAVHGDVTYSVDGHWLPLKADTAVARGTTIKTGPDATADLILQYNGTVLRLTPESALNFAKLDKELAGEDVITETSLNLLAGSIVGSQRKLAAPSHFQINTPQGLVTIKGTEYVVSANGSVSTVSGTVQVIYNLPGNKGSVKVTVQSGYSFDSSTKTVVKTSNCSSCLQNIIADINTVRQNAKTFKAGGATIVIKPQSVVTTTKGNNGVGNGQDPQPPGNPPINDGPGTGPGDPGNRHHTPQGPRAAYVRPL